MSKVNKKFGALEVVGTSNLNGITLAKSTVSQLTSATTSVSIHSPAGIISTVSSTLATNGSALFAVSNACVEADSIVLANIVNYSGTQGAPIVRVQGITRGSFSLSLRNVSDADALNGVVKVGFSVL